ncbi:MAG: VCBS repeat-containing protein [Chitinophagaceae bacterium]
MSVPKSIHRIKINLWQTLTFIVGLFTVLPACREKLEAPLYEKQDNSGIDFVNRVEDDAELNSFQFRNFYNGGGVAVGDINNDQLPDVLLTANRGPDRLYLNKGEFKFEDITSKAGLPLDSVWSTGASMVDINADGWLDIYICVSGPPQDSLRKNRLFLNDGKGNFTESAASFGLDYSGYATQASFFDYDGDGDLDCILICNSPLPFSSLQQVSLRDANEEGNTASQYAGGGNHLFRNDNGKFTEVTREAGLHTGLISFGLGLYTGDLNGDGWPDIYVGNDFIERDYFYINQGNGSFRDELEDRMEQISMSSMSTDMGDINNDGLPDLFTTDMIPDDDYRLKTTGTFDNFELYQSKLKAGLFHQFVKNSLQLNRGKGHFSDISCYSAVQGTDWSWGSVFWDGDNDGRNDLFICNGINRDLGNLDFLEYFSSPEYQRMLASDRKKATAEILKQIPVTALSNRVFRNESDLKFTEVTNSWGLAEPGFSNSLAYADFDNDGDLDLIINNENQPASLYRNQSRERNKNHYLSLQLSDKNSANPRAFGAAVRVFRDDEILYRELSPVRGFQSSVDMTLHFGLGANAQIDSIQILWPDRSLTQLPGIPADSIYKIDKSDLTANARSLIAKTSTIFTEQEVAWAPHVENDYWDYYTERNIPELLSREGPAFAMADVNGDGKEDWFLGGAQGQPGRLFLATEGGWLESEQESFNSFADFEDVAAVFFDADADGDVDLFVGAGGNNIQPGSRQLQHRLFLNDGKGLFSIAKSAFPPSEVNVAAAVAADWDGDGDMDLFIAARSVPYQYGRKPMSQLLLNNGKAAFQLAPASAFPDLPGLGMLTDAAVADLNGDNLPELIVLGTWTTPRIFSAQRAPLLMKEWSQTGLEDRKGFWQKIETGDWNNDGRTDLALGNIGQNFYLRPDSANPVRLWISDFDQNGSLESFLTRHVEGADRPVFLKREITEQFPFLKKANLRHADYAPRTIQELFDASVLGKAEKMEFNEARSIVAYNNGDGQFNVASLPFMAQLSAVRAICSADVDGDGNADLILGGNQFGYPPQFGKPDALPGLLLLGNGKGGWKQVDFNESGLWMPGETRALACIDKPESLKLIVIRNNRTPMLFVSERAKQAMK